MLGHLAKADFTGIELLRHALRNASYAPPEPRTNSEALDRLSAAGRTGVMAGKGFFDWGDRPPAELFRDRDRRLLVEPARVLRSAHARLVPARPEALHGAHGYTAERAVHWSHDSVQSQMSPSRADSLTGVPLTSTGSP